MTPFEELRLWLRQGARGERASAAVTALIVAGLVVWMAIPPGSTTGASATLRGGATVGGAISTGHAGHRGTHGSGTIKSRTGTHGGEPGGTAGGGDTASGTIVSSSGGSSTGGSSSKTPHAGSGHKASSGKSGAKKGKTAKTGTQNSCSQLAATDQGVTAKTIHIGIPLLNVAGLNGLLGVPSGSDQQAAFNAEVNYVNHHGGIACRQVVASYYNDNPLSADAEHSTCLQIASAKLFAVIGGLYTAQNVTCLAQHQLPSFTIDLQPTSEIKQFYPYLFSIFQDSTTDFRAYAYAAKQLGYFKGMKKLGILSNGCYPEYDSQLRSALSAVGVSTSGADTFGYGCPAGGLASPLTVQAAVLKFKRDGVTNVMSSGAPLAAFSSAASSQRYRPKYITSDADSTLELKGGTTGNVNPDNFNGTIAITAEQYGAIPAGLPLSKQTSTCNRIMKSGNAPSATAGDAFSGTVCDQFEQFTLAADNAPTLTRKNLAVGLVKAGSTDLSFPAGPALWSHSQGMTGGQYFRPARYEGSCQCWKSTTKTFTLSPS